VCVNLIRKQLIIFYFIKGKVLYDSIEIAKMSDQHKNEFLALPQKEAIQAVEDKYRFATKGTINYIFSRYNIRSQRRDIFYEGALNLHEITQFIPLFAEDYLQVGTKEYIYMFHIIYDQSNDLISKFEGYDLIDEEKRYEEIRVQLLKLIDFFDRVFAVFINEDRTAKGRYRTDTHFGILLKAYDKYEKEIVPELKKAYNI
jgi:hypothetical protein